MTHRLRFLLVGYARWRLRARRYKRELVAVRAQLAAECARNRQREEAWADRWLTFHNQYGLPGLPLPGKEKSKPKPKVEQSIVPTNAFEEAELAMYQDSAVEAGLSSSHGLQDWLTHRRRLMTEPPDMDELT
jgi:hypothetical protein